MSATVQPDWIKTALEVTGHFENSTEPMAGVTGDFDQQGISVGVLQWNIGCGSLQPLVKRVGREQVKNFMPVYGDALWEACTTTIPKGLSVVRSWQSGAALQTPVLMELRHFAGSAPFVAQQVSAAQDVAQRAFVRAEAWCAEGGEQMPSKKLFCWFFDLLTQNGGLKTVTRTSVRNFITQLGSTGCVDFVCNWLKTVGPSSAGRADARKNADLWKGSVPAENIELFAASYLRCRLSVVAYQVDVMNRKGTIALGDGWCHGERHRLAKKME